jgi:hypothetical protein
MKKQKIIEILITALLSAGIAFLSNVLSAVTNANLLHTNPETVGIIGGTIHTIRKFFV